MMELTKEQIKRQDFVDRSIYELFKNVNPSNREIEWNIEMIADLRDKIRYWIVEYLNLTDEMSFYPFIRE
ncbi:MAG: hypothetical protein L0Y68_02475 [Candidatus Dadabacteria bacterium]|nr:hypothetical protein [Candidatus Dadabacteria bacterium]